jgi:hypothetical protein
MTDTRTMPVQKPGRSKLIGVESRLLLAMTSCLTDGMRPLMVSFAMAVYWPLKGLARR